MTFALTMIGLFAVAVVQNAAFTAVSRSRNSGDIWHHAKWAVASNGVWFVAQILIWGSIWRAIERAQYWQIGVAGVVYVAATVIGSVSMMAHMLRTERGARRVGARG